MKNKKHLNLGFTLLEILLVVGIIAILAGIVIIAINPSRQLAIARNTERKSDLKQINNALQQYYIDHREYPDTLTDTPTDICDTGDTASSSVTGVYGEGYCDDLIDLSVLVPTYLSAVPKDPKSIVTHKSGYLINRGAGGKVTLTAPLTENSSTIISIGATDSGACFSDVILCDGVYIHRLRPGCYFYCPSDPPPAPPLDEF